VLSHLVALLLTFPSAILLAYFGTRVWSLAVLTGEQLDTVLERDLDIFS
jgi:hypothetical protein